MYRVIYTSFCALIFWLAAIPAAAQVGTDSGNENVAADQGDRGSTQPPPETISGTLVQEGPPEATALLGEPIPVTISIVHPPDVDVVLPDSFGTGRWELLSSDARTVEAEKEWKTILELKFAVFRPGETTLKPFRIDLLGRNSDGSVRSEPVTVKVLSSLDDVEGEATFAAPRAPVEVWVEDNSLYLAAGFGAVSLLFGLFFFWYRRRDEHLESVAPPRPPHEVALERLGRLAADDLVERGQHMLFYVRLSETVREYLGRRYGFKGVEMTTTEILEALDRARVTWPPSVSRDDVAEFLLHCDAVKFGGMIPSAETASEKLRRAFAFVEATRPAPVTNDGESGPETGSTPGDSEVRSQVVANEDERWRPKAEVDQDGDEPEAEDADAVQGSESPTPSAPEMVDLEGLDEEDESPTPSAPEMVDLEGPDEEDESPTPSAPDMVDLEAPNRESETDRREERDEAEDVEDDEVRDGE